GLSINQAVPLAAGRSLVRRLDYTILPPEEGARAVQYLTRRLAPYARRTMLDMAESIQRGMVDFGYGSGVTTAASPALSWFRSRLAARLQGRAAPEESAGESR